MLHLPELEFQLEKIQLNPVQYPIVQPKSAVVPVKLAAEKASGSGHEIVVSVPERGDVVLYNGPPAQAMLYEKTKKKYCVPNANPAAENESDDPA